MADKKSEKGTLFIVATPIGNLEDMTHRGIKVLSEADIIAAEDTRHSQRLLQQYAITTRMWSLHEHNEEQQAQQFIQKLNEGLCIALISDAGTPLISDPGYRLVNQCRQVGLKVVPIPGACAAITALCASGLGTDRFLFAGFLPVKQQARQTQIQLLEDESATCIFYESPRRILDTVKLIAQTLGSERQLVLAKELTKSFETFFSGTAQQTAEWLAEDTNHQKGEFVLMVSGKPKRADDISPEAKSLLVRLMQELPIKKAAAITAEQYRLKKNSLYQLALSLQ